MNWLALLAWINDPTRTAGELRAACTGLGLSPSGNRNQLLSKLRNHAGSQQDLDATAAWSPTTPNPVSAPPTPPTQPTRPFPVLTALLTLLVIGLAGLIAYMALKDDDNNGKTMTPTRVTTPTTTTSGDNGDSSDDNKSNNRSDIDACTDHEMKPGDTYQVPEGCNIKGDVQISSTNGNFKALYDSDPATGLIVSCPQGCFAFAEWGANVSPRSVSDLKSEMMNSGCVGGCSNVKHVTWPMDGKDNMSKSQPGVVSTASPCDFSIPQGAVAYVPQGCVVAGDIEVSDFRDSGFVAFYDSDQNTGLVTIADQDVWAKAPWGASVSDSNVDDVVHSMDLTGCGLPDGCVTVDVKHAS